MITQKRAQRDRRRKFGYGPENCRSLNVRQIEVVLYLITYSIFLYNHVYDFQENSTIK